MKYCVEVSCKSQRKEGQAAAGDTFLSKKLDDGKRVIAVLSDGLGSGIKAGVLSALTATTALNTMAQNLSPRKTAELIYRTLPVCKERRISYSTFTIIDIYPGIRCEIVEYDNPLFVLIRNGGIVTTDTQEIQFTGGGTIRNMKISDFVPQNGDRIIFFTDGVTQSGMGTHKFPLGWGKSAVEEYILGLVQKNPEISGRELAKKVVSQSIRNDILKARDDITCSVVYIRHPRRLILFTGPPYREDRDKELANRFFSFDGKKIVCGGTTASIVARELNLKVNVDLFEGGDLPPPSRIEGADYVAEGILTLSRVYDYLKMDSIPEIKNPATTICELFLNSDNIHFMVGTRINEAHQDPSMPVELEIRRNIVKKISKILELKFLKETKIEYI